MKTIIFSRISREDANQGYSLALIKERLRKYCQINHLEILKEFEAIENVDLGESPTLLEILNFVATQEGKITLLCYHYMTYNREAEIGQKLKELIAVQKIDFQFYCHQCFREPVNNDIKIWRYINLAKFIDLIQTQTLFFTRADFLREMDKHEGTLFTKYSQKISALLSENKTSLPENHRLSIGQHLSLESHLDAHNEQTIIKQHYINCWHMADFENFAMWKIYSETFGVCIESTYQKLCDSFVDKKWSFYNQKSRIYIGEVIYIDRNKNVIPQGNFFWPFMHKGNEFSYENELRCIISDWDTKNQFSKVRVNLNNLVQKIHISPFSPQWFKLTVDDLCNKYGINPEKVHQSTLT